jgi:phage regulator Rha-like protein
MHIFEENGQLWTTSLEIANKMNKDHKYILRDIKKYLAKSLNLDQFKFEPIFYKQPLQIYS